jgi:hypothetical protein
MIIIGNHQFKNQSAAKVFVKEKFNSYSEGETLSPSDTLFFIDLLKLREDNGIQKIGSGVKRIFVRQNKYGGNTLWIERTDGSETDFSIYKPLERKTNRVKLTQNEIDFRKACRTAIVEDKKSLKRETSSFGDAHHEIRFEELIRNFIKLYNVDVENLNFVGHRDGDYEILFSDKILETEWIRYHRANVLWNVLSKSEHKEKHNPQSF